MSIIAWLKLYFKNINASREFFNNAEKSVTNEVMPNDLKAEIHSNFSNEPSVWSDLRSQITGAYIISGRHDEDARQHLLREFNKKIHDVDPSQSAQGFFFEPKNDGFSYLGKPDAYTGAHCAFSARTVGFGGPIARARRASDNVEVDVAGDKEGVLSLESLIIDENENLLPYSEDISQWDETDGLFIKNITGGDSPINPVDGHIFSSTNIDRIVDGKLTGKLSSNWGSSDASKVNINAYVSGRQLIQNTNFERNANNWTPQDGNISVVADNLIPIPTYSGSNGVFWGGGVSVNMSGIGLTDDPDFGQNAAAIRETTGSGEHSVVAAADAYDFALPTGAKVTASSFVRNVGDRIVELTFFNGNFTSNKAARFALTGNGTVLFQNGDAATIERVVDDYYKINFELTTPSTSVDAAIKPYVRLRLRATEDSSIDDSNTSYVGDTGKGIDQFELRVFEGTETRGRVLPTSTSSYVFQPFATESGKQYRISASGSRSLETGFATNLVTNGTFASDSDWTKSSNVAIANGVATFTVTDGDYEYLFQNLSLVQGRQYKVVATVSGTAGKALRINDNTSDSGTLKSSDTETTFDGSAQNISFDWTAGEHSNAIQFVRRGDGDFSFTVDDVRVYQPNATQVQLQALDNDNSNAFIKASTAVFDDDISMDFTAVSDTSAMALLVNDNAVPSAGFFTNCSAKEIVYKAAWNTTDTQTLTQSDKLGTIGGKKYNIKFSISDYESGAIKLSQPTPSEETLFSADGTYEVEVINDAQFAGFNDIQFKNQGTTNLKVTDISAIESLPVAPYYQVYSTPSYDNKILSESTETLSVKSGDIFTASVYAKNVETSNGNLLLQINRGAGGAFEETFQSLDAASTDSWQRFTAIHEFTGTHTQLRARLYAPSIATTKGQIFGFQLNRGSGADPYFRTDGTPITKQKDPQQLRDFLYGPELVSDTKLRDSSQWDLSVANGSASFGDEGATITTTAGGYVNIRQDVTYEVGKTYIATATVNGTSGNTIRVQDDNAGLGALGSNRAIVMDGTDQTASFPFVANSESDMIVVARTTSSNGYSFTVKKLSVKEYEDAFCTTWYDQTATGSAQRNFQQPTAAYQPALTFSGTIPTGANGKAGIRWDVGKNMYINSQFTGNKLDAFFVSDFDVSDATSIYRQKHIYFTSSGNENYIIMESGSSATSIGALGNVNKTLRVNGVDYNPADPDLTRDDVFELLDHNKLYSVVGGNSNTYTGTHDNILNLGFYQSNPSTSYNFEGLMQETIIYTDDQLGNRTGIEEDMNNFYNMF